MSKVAQYSILHICKVYLPVKGGIQKVVHSISDALTQSSHMVLTTGADGAVARQQIGYATVLRCRSFLEVASMPIAPSLPRSIFRHSKKVDLICVHYPFPLAELSVALLPRKRAIIVHWHSNVVAQRKLKFLAAPFTWFLLLRASAIVVTSKRMLDNSSFLRMFKSKVHLIPYGLEARSDSERLPTESEKYFLLVARHVSYKGIDIAIRAISKTDAMLTIAGDGPLLEKHKKLVADMNLNDQVRFETNCDDDQVDALISNSLALIVPSVKENEAFALVQLEAMRMAKPVINTHLNSSVPWVARHSKEAITVQPSDVNGLAKALNLLHKDSHLANELGRNGFRRFQGKFTKKQFTESVNALYSSVAEAKE